jgi:hypothetical protein
LSLALLRVDTLAEPGSAILRVQNAKSEMSLERIEIMVAVEE